MSDEKRPKVTVSVCGSDECPTTQQARVLAERGDIGLIERGEAAGKGCRGPAQVATKSYRDNYDTIFGKRQPVGQA